MASLFRPTYVDKKTGKTKRLKRWYGKYRDAQGGIRKAPLSANKTVAEQMLRAILGNVDQERAGLINPLAGHATAPLSIHFVAWGADLAAGEVTDKHVKQTTGWARKVIVGTKAAFVADLTEEAVKQFLSALRKNRPCQALDPAKGTYSRGELAELLGVKAFSIPSLVKRHELPATGNGKARRYPAATAEALATLRSRGLSANAANHYLAAIQQFTRWLADKKRSADDALKEMKPFNPEIDRRRERRVLSADQLRYIIRAARVSQKSFRGLSGRDRAALYATAIGSGFRAEELSRLTPRHFNLSAANPHVCLSASETKNGKAVEQPLPPDVAAELVAYIAGRPEREPVWPGTWWTRAADMLRIDLDAARVPYVIDGREGPLYADLHALRHSFVALLDQSGASLRAAMQLARHSDPKLTMKTYGKLRLADLGNAVGRLPSLTTGPDVGSQAAALSATGTDGRHGPGHVPAADSGRESLRAGERIDAVDLLREASENPPNDSEREPVSLPEKAPRVGLEPTTVRLTACRLAVVPQSEQPLPATESAAWTTACTARAETEPKLAGLIAAWATLPEHIRAAVMALIETASATKAPSKPRQKGRA